MSLPNYVKFSKTETVVTLAEDRGTLKSNTYGDYFLRKFTDGRFCCAAPELERMLIDAGARAGSTVGVTCKKRDRSNIWMVRVVEAAPGPQAVARKTWPNHPVRRPDAIPESKYAPSPTAEPSLEAQLQASIEHVEAQRKPAASEVGPVTSLLTKCAIAAIDAAQAAEAYANSHGFPLKFREDQIQAWASTLYIGESKQANINLMHRNETLRNGAANGQGDVWRH